MNNINNKIFYLIRLSILFEVIDDKKCLAESVSEEINTIAVLYNQAFEQFK